MLKFCILSVWRLGTGDPLMYSLKVTPKLPVSRYDRVATSNSLSMAKNRFNFFGWNATNMRNITGKRLSHKMWFKFEIFYSGILLNMKSYLFDNVLSYNAIQTLRFRDKYELFVNKVPSYSCSIKQCIIAYFWN